MNTAVWISDRIRMISSPGEYRILIPELVKHARLALYGVEGKGL